MKIHITILGKEPLPIFYGIKEMNPEKVHLIGTIENNEIAKRIKSILEPSIICKIHLVDAYKFNDVISVCDNIHFENPTDEISYNITGGTKPMSIAAQAVAQKNNSFVFYTTQSEEIINLNTLETTPFTCKISNEDIFTFSGQKLISCDEFVENKEKYNAANSVKDFIINNSKEYEKTSKCFRQNYNANVNLLPSLFKISDILTFCKLKQGGFKLEKEEEDFFRLEHPNALSLFFEGRWWETLVANTVYNWANPKGYPVSINVKFEPRIKNREDKSNKEITKNEVDILINIGSKFIFIECKSGLLKQEDIYKVKAVRETYGSSMSKAIIASFHPVREDLIEKCEESNIHLFAPANSHLKNNNIKNLSHFLDKILIERNR